MIENIVICGECGNFFCKICNKDELFKCEECEKIICENCAHTDSDGDHYCGNCYDGDDDDD